MFPPKHPWGPVLPTCRVFARLLPTWCSLPRALLKIPTCLHGACRSAPPVTPHSSGNRLRTPAIQGTRGQTASQVGKQIPEWAMSKRRKYFAGERSDRCGGSADRARAGAPKTELRAGGVGVSPALSRAVPGERRGEGPVRVAERRGGQEPGTVNRDPGSRGFYQTESGSGGWERCVNWRGLFPSCSVVVF